MNKDNLEIYDIQDIEKDLKKRSNTSKSSNRESFGLMTPNKQLG
jgi:hypothetical protein